MNLTEKLFNYIPQLEPVEFAGLARILKVKLLEQTNSTEEEGKVILTPRVFTDVLEDLLAAFDKCNRKRKKEILALVKATIKAPRGEEDASNTEDSES